MRQVPLSRTSPFAAWCVRQNCPITLKIVSFDRYRCLHYEYVLFTFFIDVCPLQGVPQGRDVQKRAKNLAGFVIGTGEYIEKSKFESFKAIYVCFCTLKRICVAKLWTHQSVLDVNLWLEGVPAWRNPSKYDSKSVQNKCIRKISLFLWSMATFYFRFVDVVLAEDQNHHNG